MLQAGVPVAYLEQELSKLPMANEFNLEVSEVQRNGIHALYVDVVLLAQEGHGHHVHRTLKDIRELLEKSTLSMAVKQQALAIFTEIAQAEGKVTF